MRKIRKFWNEHKKEILAFAAALIVPGGLIVFFAGMLKKHFRK